MSRSYTEYTCEYCKKPFQRSSKDNATFKKRTTKPYCSRKCYALAQQSRVTSNCGFCGTEVWRHTRFAKSSKSGHIFCNNSCAAKYNIQYRKKSRRSKVEKLLCDLITQEFPQLNILPNDTTMLNGYEVDIAIPELKLAIEWNGIVHFKPIYGTEKLFKIQTRDKEKLELATKLDINLIVIPDLISTTQYVHICFSNIKTIITNLLSEEATGLEPATV